MGTHIKKPTIKRLLLGLAQHLLAAGIAITVAVIVFNSCLAVDSIHGTKLYRIDPFHEESQFEDSEMFQDIFQTAVEDITRLVVIKGQLETDGKFDPEKRIDVTQYADRQGDGNGCPVTAVYSLENLIKWGRAGVSYTNRILSLSDFVNYFEPAVSVYNFALDGSGGLYFAGYLTKYYTGEKKIPETGENAGISLKPEEELALVETEMARYTEEQLEDMAFSYLIAGAPESINVSREDDGTYSVFLPMLACRYDTVEGERQLIGYADNWTDYMKLQQNVVESIESLSENYEQYQNCNDLYTGGNSNLKYAVRVMTQDGMRTYTNLPEVEELEDNDITEFFTEYRRYIIYYPDSLGFMGSSSLTEEDIYQFMSEYEYAYPETTHVWIGVDISYPVPGDALYNAHTLFERIVPNVGKFVCLIAFMGIIWLTISIYLTITAGVGYNGEGESASYLNKIDHFWTEIMIAVAAALGYAAVHGARWLGGIAETVYTGNTEERIFGSAHLFEYGVFGLYGFLLSLAFGILWNSMARRMRGGNLLSGSFCYALWKMLGRLARTVLLHKNTAVSTLIPYNLFLWLNILSMFGIFKFMQSSLSVTIILLVALVLCDGAVGVVLFRRNAEWQDIVEGIKRIRDGEVNYKLETECLHGYNAEIADAVNNIGEGIHKAVETSMRDEQMKTDLITNVSHDIKTPLTSIVNYVDLLKRLKIEDEPAREYIEVLENKSQRLKQLTDDLVEASKISSGNIVLNQEKLNLTELLNQSIGEFSEKFEEKKLQIVFENHAVAAYIFADSRRMWRIIENLFFNVCKYALEGTRVYIDMETWGGKIKFSVKNISERQMNIRPDELTERFIRGDASRTTEGSGLGLYIAKNLVQVQGGSFAIALDGDLFKVAISFPEYVEPEGCEQQPV